jgi:hypothetical protein
MIEFNGKEYSGAIIKNDDSELIVSIMTVESMQDICIALTGVKTVTETQLDGTSVSYSVNNAVQVNASAKYCYTITFSKALTVIEELSEAIDRLLVMALEG